MKYKINFKENIAATKPYYTAFTKWLLLGLILGSVCGVVGGAFSKAISLVTNLRAENDWLIYLLPIGGLALVSIYKLCKVSDIGTNQVFESVRSEKSVPVLLSPAIFSGSVITHLLGGSAGKEGAALQLGGSISALLCKIFKLDDKSRHILTLCGMGAFFSAIFGTPIGAFIFAIEVVTVGSICSAAFLPGIISSLTAYIISTSLGVHPERFKVSVSSEIDLNILWKIALIGIAAAIVSAIFCQIMHFSAKGFAKFFKNPYLRIFVGGVIVILLTFIVGSNDYNGGGMHIIEKIFNTGEVRYEAFLLKIIFTAITIGAGFKGGEIVPTLFIGSSLGGAIAILIGLDPALGAAVGMAALFCGVTNCPIATIVISVELFGGGPIIYIALATVISFFLSGYSSLYKGQKIIFSRFNEDMIDDNP